MSSPQAKPRRRRWFQFSLRTLLALTAALAALTLAYAKLIEPYRLQREAMAAITKLGGTYKTEDATGWVRYLDKNAQDVVVVDLAECDKPDEYLPHLARLPKLRSLVIGGHSVGDEQVAALGRVAGMRGLVLDSTKVGDEGLERLKENLPDLMVYKCQRRAFLALRAIGALTSDTDIHDHDRPISWDQPAPPAWLQNDIGESYLPEPVVYVSLHNPRATEADLVWLSTLDDVRALHLMQTGTDGSFLAGLKAIRSLERLYLDETNLTDANLAHVTRFPNLTWLDIGKTGVSDEGLAHLSALRKLEVLELTETQITDAGLRHLAGLPRLQYFGALKTSMGDQGLATVVELPSLEALNIPDTLVSDEGLCHLERSKTVRRVWLNGTKISDSGIPLLRRLTHLTALELERTAISPEGIKELRKALPHCDVRY